jgi:CheY-like chemotaxis protein
MADGTMLGRRMLHSRPDAEAPTSSSHRPRLLVIDDDPDICYVARTSFEEVSGWQVLTATSAGEGVAVARHQQPDAILLDVRMPGFDGLATCRQLRAEAATEAIPVLLFTIVPEQCSARELAALGVQGIVRKPFDPLRLPQQVAATLGWPAPARR